MPLQLRSFDPPVLEVPQSDIRIPSPPPQSLPIPPTSFHRRRSAPEPVRCRQSSGAVLSSPFSPRSAPSSLSGCGLLRRTCSARKRGLTILLNQSLVPFCPGFSFNRVIAMLSCWRKRKLFLSKHRQYTIYNLQVSIKILS